MARFTNQAQLRYGNNVANSNIAVGEILEVLSATKTAVKNTYNQNDTITYVVSIVNSGNTAINGLTLSDNLGAYTFNTNTLVPLTYVNNTAKYYTNGTLQAAPAVTQGPPLSITGINVPAGGNATVIYEAALNEYAPLGTEASVTNTATVSGTGITPVTAAETVNAEAAPNLAITKSVSPVPVTENGTQLLPESQLDRFMICMSMGYPSHDAEVDIAKGKSVKADEYTIKPVMNAQGLVEMQGEVEQVFIHDSIYSYIVDLVDATRTSPYIELGVSPRGTIACVRMAKAYAYLSGRSYVIPSDVVSVFADVTKHRIVLNTKARVSHVSELSVIDEILKAVKQPTTYVKKAGNRD